MTPVQGIQIAFSPPGMPLVDGARRDRQGICNRLRFHPLVKQLQGRRSMTHFWSFVAGYRSSRNRQLFPI